MVEKADELCAELFKMCSELDADHVEIVVRNTDTDKPVAGVFVTTNPELAAAVENFIERYVPEESKNNEVMEND